MQKANLTIAASAVVVSAGVLGIACADQAKALEQSTRLHRATFHQRAHRDAVHRGNDITSFSSSSELHVGVNHPPRR